MRLKLQLFISFMLIAFGCGVAAQAKQSTNVVGDVRVQVLSPTLVRIELKGPEGFEDRSTFHIVERDWDGVSVKKNVAEGYVNLTTKDFVVKVPQDGKGLDGIVINNTDGELLWEMPQESASYTAIKCRWVGSGDAYLCDSGDKVGYGPSVADDTYLWKVESIDGYTRISNKATGDYVNIENNLEYVECTPVEGHWTSKDWQVKTVEGYKVLTCRWPMHKDFVHIEGNKGYLEHSPLNVVNAEGKTMDKWWSCLWSIGGQRSGFFSDNRRWLPHPKENTTAWAFCDTPRYVPADWGYNVPPVSAGDVKDNGWDLDNDSADVYVFLPKGDSKLLRKEYITLTGRTDLIPLYGFGAWDSRYYPYTQEYASNKIDRYREAGIPLDVFVVDTDWRVGASHGYGVATDLFPDMEGFIQEAHDKNLRVTFNDHPEPQGDCLDKVEVEYRNEGLRSKFDIGMDFWWFDRNWHTSLLPPAGINKEVFGMYIFHWITQDYYKNRRPFLMANFDGIDNGIINRPPNIAAHRYNLQWTGDTVSTFESLQREIRNAVYAGVFAPFAYVSTDLGGHMGKLSTEQYSRWVQFGALSPNFRLHCGVGYTRNPWDYDDFAMSVVRDYVKMRMRLIPVFYNWARKNFDEGEPILRRCDLDYPEYAEAEDNLQYLLGDGILVAPVCKDSTTTTPGSWLSNSGKSGLKAEYYDNKTLAGDAVVSRNESEINFNWYDRSPAEGVPANAFSARFGGEVTVKADFDVKLGLTADDGCRMWIGDELVIDAWKDQGPTTYWAKGNYKKGQTYPITIEYYENTAGAVCVLSSCKVEEAQINKRDLWLPPGTWVDCWTGKKVTGPKTLTRSTPVREMPLYVKAGTIVTLAPDMQYTEEKPWDNITLDIYPASSTPASSRLYEDDRMSNEYRDGKCRETYFTCSANEKKNTVKVDISAGKGSYDGAYSQRGWTVRLRQPLDWTGSYKVKSVKVDGKKVPFKMIARDENAMPFSVTGGAADSELCQITLDAKSVKKARSVEVKYVSIK